MIVRLGCFTVTRNKRSIGKVTEAPGKFSQLDILLPSQHYGRSHKSTPEQRLMIAVLHDALDCVEKYRFATDPEGRRLFQEAKKWLLADEADWPYSFECICGILDLDSAAVLQHILVATQATAEPQRLRCG
ncbi:MAG: hypothetical protein HY270_21185 [Deltaproteobacteria bacterium]|nr:hypothetical protein [Deltaproteobacteria bacterium]